MHDFWHVGQSRRQSRVIGTASRVKVLPTHLTRPRLDPLQHFPLLGHAHLISLTGDINPGFLRSVLFVLALFDFTLEIKGPRTTRPTMSSTRSASPASDGGSPEPLTPRSKIRALLAAVDNSDDEGTNEKTKKPSPIQALAARGSPAPRSASVSGQSDASEEESEEEVRPRGRLAARMFGGNPASKSSSTVQSPKQDASTNAEEKSGDVEMEEASDDAAIPVAPRRLQRRAPRSPTPEASGAPARSPSPGLFVSSPPQPSPGKPVSDVEDELPTLKSDRFKALVERKKQERLAREAAEEAKKAERRAHQEKLASEISQLDSDDNNVSDITDDEGGRKLTQEARPTRKASKKAIEEMNRETQRMQRSMQLAHEAKTRKKISKNSLFERFNFKPVGMQQPEEPKTTSSSRPGTPNSDVEMKDAGTPPSSPPAEKAEAPTAPAAPTNNVDEDLLRVDELLTAPPTLDKGKGKAVAEHEPETKPKRQVRVRFPLQSTVNHVRFDSDDELEVTTTETDKLKALFDRVPAKTQESKSNQTLRALAQLHSPGKSNSRNKNIPSGMTSAQLEASLYRKARRQAKTERDRRLELLKAQGVVVQTAEEREKEMQEVDDIVAKARLEAEQIMQQERAAAKKNGGKGDEADPLAWDDSEDEDFQDPEDPANEADAEIELSGSEDEEGEDEEDGDEERTGMFDEAAEDGDSESEQENVQDAPALPAESRDQNEEQDDDELPTNTKRRRNKTMIVSDDEDAVEATPKSKTQATPTLPTSVTPGSVLRSAKKTFIPGLPVQGPAGLGLTQMFAGTMDDSQVSAGPAPTHSMMPDFDAFPDSNFSATADAAESNVEPATQMETQAETQGVQFNFEQSQAHGLDSLMRDHIPNTQASEMIEPSQDAGFQEHTPLKERFMDAPHSTVETVVLGEEEAQESPLVRRGRLRRKIDASIPEEELEPTAPVESTAFTAMKDAAKNEKKKAAIEEFNRKKSKAKDLVEEHAEESEDEYAGLGGYDGEDSDNESTASVKEMIDDAAGNNADDRKLAAFYA